MTTPTTVNVRLKLRSDTASNWTSANPTLLTGELGRETDTGKIKIGNGSTAWTSLAYQGLIPNSGIYPLSQLLLPAGTVSAPSLAFDGDVNVGIYKPSTDQLAITTNGVERMRLTSTGQLRLAGAGMTFKGDTATANELDDYEEGTFTPTIEGTSTAGAGTYAVQIGRYTKIGNRVLFQCYVTWTAHTGTGNMNVAGLPFTTSAATNTWSTVSSWSNNVAFTAGNTLQPYTAVNTTKILLRQVPTGGGASTAVALDTAGELMLAGHYIV